jgi:hypothetical protein
MGLTFFSMQKTDHKGVMAAPPATQDKSLPGQIPPTAPAQGLPEGKAAPSGDPGSKARDVPK